MRNLLHSIRDVEAVGFKGFLEPLLVLVAHGLDAWVGSSAVVVLKTPLEESLPVYHCFKFLRLLGLLLLFIVLEYSRNF